MTIIVSRLFTQKFMKRESRQKADRQRPSFLPNVLGVEHPHTFLRLYFPSGRSYIARKPLDLLSCFNCWSLIFFNLTILPITHHIFMHTLIVLEQPSLHKCCQNNLLHLPPELLIFHRHFFALWMWQVASFSFFTVCIKFHVRFTCMTT